MEACGRRHWQSPWSEQASARGIPQRQPSEPSGKKGTDRALLNIFLGPPCTQRGRVGATGKQRNSSTGQAEEQTAARPRDADGWLSRQSARKTPNRASPESATGITDTATTEAATLIPLPITL